VNHSPGVYVKLLLWLIEMYDVLYDEPIEQNATFL